MIFGFPWEQPQQWIDTAGWLSELPFDFLKVHQLHIVSHTALADMYRKNPFSLISYPEYIKVITAFLERLSPHIVIQRLFGEAPPRTLIAPHWGIRNSQLLKLLDEALELNDTWQGKKYGK